MKKIIALCVSSIFALTLGLAYGQEDTPKNPWEMNQPTIPAKKEDSKKKKKDQTAGKAKNRKSDKKIAKKAPHKKAMVKKASVEKTETKEPEHKKKFIFW